MDAYHRGAVRFRQDGRAQAERVLRQLRREAAARAQQAAAKARDLRDTDTAKKAASALHDLREGEAAKKAEAAINDLRASDAGKKAESAIADLRQREPVKKAEESARKVLHDLFSGGDNPAPPRPPDRKIACGGSSWDETLHAH